MFGHQFTRGVLCMPHALEIVGGQATAPGATLTALTMNTGNSSTVRNADLSSIVALTQTWARNNVAGIWRIRSPKLHDNVQGDRFRIPVNDPGPLLMPGTWQRLVPQDTLTLELSGSAVAGQIEQAFMLIYYSDLPGNAARFIGWQELSKRTMNVWTTEISIVPGVAGNWSGQVAINSSFDNFKANTDYALVGYECDVQCGAVRFTGPDFSNLGIGGPGMNAQRWWTAQWFPWLSNNLGIPLIPVFNAANKFGTLVDIASNQAGGQVNVTAILHELAPVGATGFSSGIV
jgi:hypothetical protein